METSNGNAGVQRSDINKVAVAAMAGASIEWYDFFIFASAAALVFPSLFFPGFGPLAGVLASFAVFWAAFIARPIGGALFGHFGDKFGRKPVLVTALLSMGTATFLIGVLPTFQTIGVLAPIVLVVLRFVQGLSIGGQWGGATLLATEHAPSNRRGFYGSFGQVGVPVGVVTANLLFLGLSAGLSDAQFAAWGWRIPFLASIILIGVALYIQLRIEETPAFQRLEQASEAESGEEEAPQERSPVLEVLRSHTKQVTLAAGAFFVVNGAFYIYITGILDYGTRELGLSETTMLAAVLISSFFQIPALMFFAALSDRLGRRPVFLAGAALTLLWAIPLFLLTDTRSFVLIAIALCVAQLFLSMMYGPQAALFSEMFSARVRYSGASLGYQLASVFAGGLAPVVSTSLLAYFGSSMAISGYIIAMSIITFVSVYLVTETFQNEMEDVRPEGAEAAATRGPATG